MNPLHREKNQKCIKKNRIMKSTHCMFQISTEKSIPNDINVNDIYINTYPGALINFCFHACK